MTVQRRSSKSSQVTRGHADTPDGAVSCARNHAACHGTFASPRAVSLVALVLAGTLLHAQGVQAKTFVVVKPGSVNCAPEAGVAPTYPTIKLALDAVPFAANAAHIVIVCPGDYPEQLFITKPVTIRGALRDGTDPASMDGNSNGARIVPPAGGLLAVHPNAPPGFVGNVAAQVSAQGITDLNMTGLEIEGTGIGCPLGANGFPMPTAGLALYNVGQVGTSHKATISKMVVHNQIGYCGTERKYTADGIVAENSWILLDSNSLSNVDVNLIHQIRGVSKITNNWLNFGWKGIFLENVSETYSTVFIGSTVSSNTVSNFLIGILLHGSSNVLVSLNTVVGWTSAGIELTDLSTDNDVLSNKIIDSEYAIYLTNGTARTNVKLNTIIRAPHVAILSAFSDGGNVITTNTINQSPIGVFGLITSFNPSGFAADDVVNPNTYFNTTVLTTTGPSVP